MRIHEALPRMIALDMDGTLVHPGGTVTNGNQASLQRARESGARIVIATGRRHSYAMKVLRTAGMEPDDIVLSSNGTVARTVGGDLLFRETMPLETAEWLCAQLGEYRDAFVFTFDKLGAHGEDMPGALVLEQMDELHGSIGKWMEANAPYIRRVVPIEDALLGQDGHPGPLPIQAMLCGSMDRMERAMAQLATTHEDRVSLHRTEYPGRNLCIVDILPRGCSKGSGLRRLLALEGMTPDDLMAIGDNWNDMSMLELARWPALMGNAPETLLELATQNGWPITRSHDLDGVSEAMERHFPARVLSAR
jgi:hydroxymethylpyrimidine pyrophosphatase-like HAD family hydrolase